MIGKPIVFLCILFKYLLLVKLLNAGNSFRSISVAGISSVDGKEIRSMTLSFVRQPLANAGNDARICQSSSYTLSGSISNASSAYWTTTGDGTFNNPDILNATYTPGQNDILNDSVILVLNATGLPPWEWRRS